MSLKRKRRKVQFTSYDELLSDVKAVACNDHTTVGEWTLAQILSHLSAAMESSIDGFVWSWPAYIRLSSKLVLMKPIFLKWGMPAGLRFPKSAIPHITADKNVSLANALERFHCAVKRRQQEDRCVPHPALGRMTLEDWHRFHLRHAELHLSFVVPISK